MIQCKQSKCEKEATHIVHWPGNSTPQCEEHTDKLIRLGRHMGFDISATPIKKDDE